MLVSLRLDSKPLPQPDDVLGLMLECHERIRRFSALSTRLGSPAGVPAEQLSDAAARVAHYFAVGLMRHAADEDLSLLPRLLAAGIADAEKQALEEMAQQHALIVQQVERLTPLWTALRDTPEQAAVLADRLLPASQEFEQLMEAHLQLEERVIFPAARRLLPAQELKALHTEFRQRRVA